MFLFVKNKTYLTEILMSVKGVECKKITVNISGGLVNSIGYAIIIMVKCYSYCVLISETILSLS